MDEAGSELSRFALRLTPAPTSPMLETVLSVRTRLIALLSVFALLSSGWECAPAGRRLPTLV